MEVAEQANGVQKSSTSMSENSSEVSVEKTASGTIESAKTQHKSVEQSVQQSVQKTEQSTRVVQQSVTSSSSEESGDQKPKKVVKKEKSVEKKEKKVEKVSDQPEEETKKISKKATVVEEEEIEVEVKKEPKKEEPKKEEPKKEEPKIEEPKIEEPKKVEPKVVEKVEDKKSEEIVEEIEEEVEEVEEVEEDEESAEEKPVAKQQDKVIIEDVEDDEETETTTTVVLKKKTIIVESEPKSESVSKTIVKQESEASSESEEELDEESIKSKKEPSESPAESADDESEESDTDTKPCTQTTVTREPTQNNQKSPDGTQQLKEALSLQQSEKTTNEASNRVGDSSSSGKDGGAVEIKQENIKNTLKEIISDIDRVIEQEEQVQRFEKADKPASQPERNQQQDAKTGPQKPIDLQKIFTPAEDAEEIVPQRNRKLYASSAFFTPGLHPTVEDQVELARRISSSLCDSSNQQSKGQSMYVNRMKRSVKWVHEGEGQAENQQYNGYGADNSKENHEFQQRDKLPLKLVMDPRGQVQDLTTLQNCGVSIDNSGMLSPDRCAELVTALYAPQGKGAELFAKRRKRSEKWIVDETTAATRSPSGAPSAVPYSPIPAYTDAGVQRVQQNMKLDQIQAKYAEPRVKLVKSPWEAALQTGSANTAFEESQSYQQERSFAAPPPQQPDPYGAPIYQQYSQPSRPVQPKSSSNSIRDLAYKPSIPQGWNAPPPNLPSDSPSFEDKIIHKTYATLDHTVENASCFVQSLSNYNSLSHALSLYVDVQSDELSNSTINSDLVAQNQVNQVDQFLTKVHTKKEVSQNEDYTSFKSNATDFYRINAEDTSRNVSREEHELFQSKHVQLKNISNDEMSTTPINGTKITEDSSDKENEENYENEETYTKIPVKDLISTFEKQTRPIIRYKLREDKLPQPSKMTIGMISNEIQSKEMISSTCDESKQILNQNNKFESYECQSYNQNISEYHEENVSTENENYVNGNCENDTFDSQTQQDVYTPPEIPLHVYGAPPANNYLPSVQQPQYNASQYQAPSLSSAYSPYQRSVTSPPTVHYKPTPIAYSPLNQGINQNQSPTPYTPSPISNDKLAIFEQNQQCQSTQNQSRLQTRRPLTVPNTIVRNQSPLPYGTSASKPMSYGQQQKYPPQQGQPITLYNNTNKNIYQSEENYSYNSSQVNSSRTPMNLEQMENYNRAARGWGQSRDYYRPITFTKPKVALPYSDF